MVNTIIPGFGSMTPDVIVVQEQGLLLPGEVELLRKAIDVEEKWMGNAGFKPKEDEEESIVSSIPLLHDLRDLWYRVRKEDQIRPDYFGDWGDDIAQWVYLEQAEGFMKWKHNDIKEEMLRRHSMGRRREAGPKDKPYVTILHCELFSSQEHSRLATDIVRELFKSNGVKALVILCPLIRTMAELADGFSKLGYHVVATEGAGQGVSVEGHGASCEIDVYFGLPPGA